MDLKFGILYLIWIPIGVVMEINVKNIPDELKVLEQWVCWRYEKDPARDKFMKVPYSASTGRKASVIKPETWNSLTTTIHSCRKRPIEYDGIGIVLTESDDLVGVDIDDCIDGTGKLTNQALEVLELLNSYTEISPSGKGLRVFVKADLGDFSGRRKGNIELYNYGRYLTVTGNTLPNSKPGLEERITELRELYRRFLVAENNVSWVKPELYKLPSTDRTSSDEEVIRRMFSGKNGELCRRIFGQMFEDQDYGLDSDDHSLNDTILFNALAYYTYRNAKQMKRILLSSPRALMREEKWCKEVKKGVIYLDYQIADSLKYITRRFG
ncbi:MAG: hypothetical protein R3A44_25810 [Caldilineaceae bacterium]